MRRVKKIIQVLLCLTISVTILVGCNSNKVSEEDIQRAKDLFQTNETVEYEEPELNIANDYNFEYAISEQAKNLMKAEGEKINAIFSVYVDASLQRELPITCSEVNGKIEIKPGHSISLSNSDIVLYGDDNWGKFHHYYLVQDFDLDTGVRLEKRLVTVFTIEQELEIPEVEIIYQEDGILDIEWQQISKATEYYLLKIDFQFNGEISSQIVDTVTTNQWNSDINGKDQESVEEQLFKIYEKSKDEQHQSVTGDWWDSMDEVAREGIFGVIASDGTNVSAISWSDDYENQPASQTCKAATLAMQESNITGEIDTIEDLPASIPVTSCDGNTVYRQVQVDEEEVEIERDMLVIPYQIENSTIKDIFYVRAFDDNNYQDIIKEQISKNMETHDISSNTYVYQSRKAIPFDVESSSTLPDIKDSVFSTSSLETFIASNMIAGASYIDVSAFDEDVDMYDLIEQIRNQNPLILEFVTYQYNSYTSSIYVQYFFNNDVRKQMQQTVRDEVQQAVNQIISPEMSEVEKVYAINQYLCDKVEYDYDAAKATTSNEGYAVEEHYIANTIAGVFINDKAVCEGYATAFMMLCEAANIDSIMVTGYMASEPNQRHAWNRVLLNDQWYLVDVTSNDDDDVPNSVLVLNDEVGNQLYIQDEYFLLDDDIDMYIASGDNSLEYYRYHGQFVNVSEAASILVSKLSNSNRATIKLPETTAFTQCEGIADSVVASLNRGVQYYYVSGVLTMELL